MRKISISFVLVLYCLLLPTDCVGQQDTTSHLDNLLARYGKVLFDLYNQLSEEATDSLLHIKGDLGKESKILTERATLRGIPGVKVAVENIDAQAKQDGLHQHELQTDVELRLRQSGIQVCDETYEATLRNKFYEEFDEMFHISQRRDKLKNVNIDSTRDFLTTEWAKSALRDCPLLIISVGTIEAGKCGYIYSCSLELQRWVKLVRKMNPYSIMRMKVTNEIISENPSSYVMACGDVGNSVMDRILVSTWGREIFGIVPTGKMPREIRDIVADLVNEFINDYLAVNPKTN